MDSTNFYKNKKVLVTGGAGFIGSHLVERLVNLGAKVTVPIRNEESSTKFLNHVKDDINMVIAELEDKKRTQEIVQGMDIVMHLAKFARGLIFNKGRQGSIFSKNLVPFINVLEAAQEHGVERFLTVSSACIYPRNCSIPTPEEEGTKDEPEISNIGYGWAKRMQEFFSKTYYEEHGMNIAIARPYNAYGPRDDFGPDAHVIPSLIRRIMQGENPLIVWGDGNQSRSFLYVDDFVDGLLTITEKYPKADPINIGANQETQIKKLVELMLHLSNKKPQIVFSTAKPTGQPRRNCDTSKAEKILGYKARTNLEDGLKKTIDWYIKYIKTAEKIEQTTGKNIRKPREKTVKNQFEAPSIHQNIKNYYTTLKKCKLCGSSDLTEVLRLKPQYLSPRFVKSNEKDKLSQIKIPMTLVLCDRAKNPDGCGLLQLKEMVYPDLLYRDYFYRSATSGIMHHDLKNFADDVISRLEFESGDIIIDIGANDMTTLAYFSKDLDRIGVEPARNIEWKDVDPSIKIVNDYFSYDAMIPAMDGKLAKAITATAMFYDLEDPNTFVSEVKKILHPEGIFSIQLSYLALMIKNMNFYDICNEHLSYYSLRTLNTLMCRHGLKIIDASTNGVNGGSLRVFITHENNTNMPVHNDRLEKLYKDEDHLNLFAVNTYKKFYKKMVAMGKTIKNLIMETSKENKPTIGLGASTKGNVLLQFFGIDKKLLPYISERNPSKVGLRTLGTDIKLISEKKARSLKPAYMLVLPWYFKNEIVARESKYLNAGGGLIFPMPYPHTVKKDGEHRLA